MKELSEWRDKTYLPLGLGGEQTPELSEWDNCYSIKLHAGISEYR